MLSVTVGDSLRPRRCGRGGACSLRASLLLLLGIAGTPGIGFYAEAVRSFDGWLIPPQQISTSTAKDYQGAVSPDGQWVVYVSDRTGNPDLWLRSLDAVNILPERQLTTATASDSMPCWSPDGKRLAFVSNADDPKGDIVVLKLESRKLKRLTDRTTWDRDPAWAPNGKAIVFAAGTSENRTKLYRVSPKGGEKVRVTESTARHPAFSSDGRWIAFDSLAGKSSCTLWVIPSQSGAPRQITGGTFMDIQPCFSTDGRSLFFVRFADDTNLDGATDIQDRPSLWRVPLILEGTSLVGGKPYPLTSSGAYAIFPRARQDKILFTGQYRSGLDLWSLPATGRLRVGATAQEQLAFAKTLEQQRQPRPYLAVMAYRRLLRDFGEQAGAGLLLAEGQFRLAGIYRGLGDTARALAELDDLIGRTGATGLYPGLARTDRILLGAQARLEKIDRTAEMVPIIREAVAKLDRVAESFEGNDAVVAAALLATGRLWLAARADSAAQEKVVRALGRVLKRFPRLPEACAEALFRRAAIYEGLGSSDALKNIYLSILQQYPQAQDWCARASRKLIDLTLAGGKSEGDRLSRLRRIVQEYAHLPVLPAMALNQSGDILYESYESARARETYERVVRDFAKEKEQAARALFSVAHVYYAEQNYEKTLDTYARIQKRFQQGNDEIYRLARARYIRRKLEHAQRQLSFFREPQSALKEFLQVTRFDNSVYEAHRGAIAAADAIDRAFVLRKSRGDPNFRKKATLTELHPELVRLLGPYQEQWKGARHESLSPEALAVACYATGLIYTYFDFKTYLDTAIDYLQKAIAANGQEAFPHQTLGFAYEQKATMAPRSRRRKQTASEWLRMALEEYLSALKLNDERENESAELSLLLNLGNIFSRLDDPGQAYDYYGKAFQKYGDYFKERKPPFDQEERCLVFLERFGRAAYYRGQFDVSIESSREAIQLAETSVPPGSPAARKQIARVAKLRDQLGLAYQENRQYRKAGETFLQVRELNRQLGNVPNAAKATRNAATNFYFASHAAGEIPDEGELSAALENFEEVLRERPVKGPHRKADKSGDGLVNIKVDVGLAESAEAASGFDRQGEERLLYTYIGRIYRESLDYGKAIAAYEQKLRRYPAQPDEAHKVAVFTALGVIHNQLGYFHYKRKHYDKAEKEFEKSSELAREIEAWQGLVINAANLGRMACVRAAVDPSLEAAWLERIIRRQRQALLIIQARKLQAMKRFRVHLANHLGALFFYLAQRDRADLEVVKRAGGSARIANSLAALEHAGASAAYFQKAIDWLQASDRPPDLSRWREECTLHFSRAQVALAASDVAAARESLSAAQALAERYHLDSFVWKVQYQQALLAPPDKQLELLERSIDSLEQAPPIDPVPAADQELAGRLYRDVVARLFQSQEIGPAFKYAERSQEQALTAQVAGRQLPLHSPEYQAAYRQLDDAYQALKKTRSEIARHPLLPDSGPEEKQNHSRLQLKYQAEFRQARQIEDRLKEEFPELFSLIKVSPTPFEEIQQLLPKDAGFLKYVIAGGAVHVGALTAHGFTHSQAALNPALRKALENGQPLSEKQMALLSWTFLQPVANFIKEHPRVYLDLDGRLLNVPWDRLELSKGRRLGEAAELSFLNSASHYFYAFFKRSPHKKTVFLAGSAASESLRAQQVFQHGYVVDEAEEGAQPKEVLGALTQYHAAQINQPVRLELGRALEAVLPATRGLKRFHDAQLLQALSGGEPYSMTEYDKDQSSGLIILSDVQSDRGFGGRGAVGAVARTFTFAGFPSMLVYVRPVKGPADPKKVDAFLSRFYEHWRKHSAARALQMAKQAARQAGMSPDFLSRFRVYGHLGMNEQEANEFATVNYQDSVQAAVEARSDRDWPDAVRYFENALSLAEILGRKDDLPNIYRNLAIGAFNAHLYRKAIYYGEQQVASLEGKSDAAALAQANLDLGVIYNEAGRYRDGVGPLARAAAIYQQLESKKKLASALSELGNVQQFAGDYRNAIETLLKSVAIGNELNARAQVSRLLQRIGAIYYVRLNNNLRAEEFFSRAANLLRKELEEGAGKNAQQLFVRCTIDLGLVDIRRGHFDKARARFQEALKLAKSFQFPRYKSEVLLSLANTYWFQGDYQQALLQQRQALSVASQAGDKFRQETALNTAGLIYWTLNEYDRSLESLHSALEICRAMPGANGRLEVASTYNNIGLIYRSLGKYGRALKNFNAAFDTDKKLKTDWGMAYDERNIGMTYLRMGRLAEATRSLESAVARTRRIGDTTNLVKSLFSLGDARRESGKLDTAQAAYAEAVTLARKHNIKEIMWRAEQGLGRTALSRGQPGVAFAHFKEAIDVVERMRASIKIDEFKNGFITNKLDLYEDMVLLMLDQGKPAEAFVYTERSRGRNFIDLLGNRDLKLASRKDQQTLARQLKLRAEIEKLEEELAQAPEKEREAARKKLLGASRKYQDFLIELRLKDPQLSSFVSVDPLQVADVQKLLEPGVYLLEYLVARKELIVWIISAQSVKVQRTPYPREKLRKEIQSYRKLIQSIGDIRHESRQLYDLLIRPALPHLSRAKVLGIVPHDRLHYLSFASLNDGDSYLVEKFPLFYIPSASVLRYSIGRRSQMKNRRVFAVGNPDIGNEALALPFAEKEVDSIHWNFPETDVLKRKEASEDAVVRGCSDYGIIHIASHGEFDPMNPLFSRILLARGSASDGNLEVDEIFRLTLKADLVVLSACQSGLGKIQQGDEIVGMNRAFTYAGTHSLLSTLWRVSDVSTAILVKHFYRSYASMDKAHSLRKAQLQVLRNYPHPAYWAAFVLTGDYK